MYLKPSILMGKLIHDVQEGPTRLASRCGRNRKYKEIRHAIFCALFRSLTLRAQCTWVVRAMLRRR